MKETSVDDKYHANSKSSALRVDICLEATCSQINCENKCVKSKMKVVASGKKVCCGWKESSACQQICPDLLIDWVVDLLGSMNIHREMYKSSLKLYRNVASSWTRVSQEEALTKRRCWTILWGWLASPLGGNKAFVEIHMKVFTYVNRDHKYHGNLNLPNSTLRMEKHVKQPTEWLSPLGRNIILKKTRTGISLPMFSYLVLLINPNSFTFSFRF